MSDSESEATPVNQAFLVGPTLYLRPMEPEDAQTAAIWRETPFPVPIEVAEEQIKEVLSKDDGDLEYKQQLIICRKENDQPVGSVEVDMGAWRFGDIKFALDRLAPATDQDSVMAETIDILVPWLLEERSVMTLIVWVIGEHRQVQSRIRALGGREHVRHRERYLFDGTRHDLIAYQFFHPVWVEKLGLPAEPEFGSPDRDTRSPARPVVKLDASERPSEAVVVGEKLYLRAVRPDEGKLVARWTREETEVYYPEGRLLYTAHSFAEMHKKIAESDLPTYVRFAIVLRDTDELIGCNGLEDISWVHRFAETETEIFKPEHRSAGYGTEAKHLLLEFAFERIGLHGVISYVAETNPRSAQALRKQGYRDAGTVEWDSFCPTGICKYYSFDLLASEWRTARDRGSS